MSNSVNLKAAKERASKLSVNTKTPFEGYVLYNLNGKLFIGYALGNTLPAIKAETYYMTNSEGNVTAKMWKL